MRAYPSCRFDKLEVTSYKRYWKVQTYEQVYMALQVIKQGMDEKVEVYYEHILKLVNYLQHQTNDILLTTFFWIGFQP